MGVLALFKQIVCGQGDGFRDLDGLSGSTARMKQDARGKEGI